MKLRKLALGACALASTFILTSCGNVSGLKINNFDIGKSLQAATSAKNAIVPLTEAEEIELGEGIASNFAKQEKLQEQNQTYLKAPGDKS